MSKNSKSYRIIYNAPVTLTFAFICTAVLLINTFVWNETVSFLFTCAGGKNSPLPFNFSSVMDYLRLILHIFGNTDWTHLIYNFTFILLLGPVIEEKYGSFLLIIMMAITSLVSGVLNVCFGTTVLTGSSDIVFMMVLLASFNSISKKEIPLSFILVLILYIGREVLSLFSTSVTTAGLSAVAHITGGICGSLFAFLATPKSKETKSKRQENSSNSEKTSFSFPNPDKKARARLEEIDSESPRFKNKKPASAETEESTVVGTIDL